MTLVGSEAAISVAHPSLLSIESRPGRPQQPPAGTVRCQTTNDKRLLRQLKRSIKQSGNRKRRRYLKDVSTDADSFSLGDDSSAFMNERRQHYSDSKLDDGVEFEDRESE